MTEELYKKELNRLEEKLQIALDSIKELKTNFAIANCKYEVGDFVGNVTGIIKIDKIEGHMDGFGQPSAKLLGYRYHKKKGELVKTKTYNKVPTIMYDNIVEKIDCHQTPDGTYKYQ